MKHIRNFDNYKKQRLLQENRFNSQVLLLQGVELSNDDERMFLNIFEKFLDSYKDESIKEEIKQYLNNSELLNEGFLNEGFFDKLKERFPKAAEVSKSLSDKAEAAMGKILKSVKDAVSFVKKIGQGIKEFFMSVVEKGKTFFTEQIMKGKLKGKIDELTSTNKEGLVADLKTSKEVIDFYRKSFMGKLLGSTEKNMTEFMTNEQEPIAESMVNEGKNVIATLVHGVEQIPPFSWLHKVAQAGEAGAAALVKAISGVTEKLGGPSFQLPVIVLLVGIVIEQMVKGSAGHWLIDLAGSTTPLGLAIKGVKTVAFFVALIVALDASIGEKLLGGHGDGHVEEKDKEGEPKDTTEVEKSEDESTEAQGEDKV
jgi:hypothetical protein